ncbi:polysaccharide biosynthesis protein [Gilvimarinus sp. F26214L]|uniref:polysaccharide biosynthesis protein n=1 Tax=Gilvimarinus sp. DZF01 TaxID=3461371 RepID=UPI00404632F1
MLRRLLESSRGTKRTVSLAYDVVALAFSFYVAICLRLGRTDIELGIPELATLATTITVSLAVFIRLGLYRAILRFMAHQALISVALGVLASAAALAASSFFLHAWVPRSVPIIYAFTALFFVGTPRLLMRHIVLVLYTAPEEGEEPVIIYGAGHSGFQLASALQGSRYRVVGLVDDDPLLHGRLLRGLVIRDPRDLPEIVRKKPIKHILLALDNVSRSRRASIVNTLEPLEISVKTIPAMDNILSGKQKIEDIRDVEVEDLLGRDPVAPVPALMNACIARKHVLVTGAGGSIGSELCRQILKQHPTRLVLFDISEFNLYRVEQELNAGLGELASAIELIPIIGSIQNRSHFEYVLSTFSIDTVYHAAAYKHVPLIEHNLIEGVRNNVFGTWHCAEAAVSAGVESFVLISTDKAVRPTNIMGAAKRLAELVLQAMAKRQTTTRFTMVRFGNVLGSSGSVVPLFRQQIKDGGPVTVTHPEIIRYFMTIPEAAELVIQAGSMGKGGDVFVLDMGKPVRIVDLAKRMIHLSGLTLRDEDHPQGDIQIEFTGLRPGEKLFEELLVGEDVSGTDHPRILRAEERAMTWEQTESVLTQLARACDEFAYGKIRDLLLLDLVGYCPETENLHDSLWLAKRQRTATEGLVIPLESATARKTHPA